MHFDPVVVLNHFVELGMLEPSTMGGANAQGRSLDKRIRFAFFVESSTSEKKFLAEDVPPPLSGDYTPIPQEEIDDTLYVYGKKGPQTPKISVSDESTSEHSSCQSNDSEGSCENISEHSFETESESLSEPNEKSKSRLEVNNEKDMSAPKSKEVEPSCVSHIKTPRQPLKDKETHKVNRKNWNEMMKRELGEGYSFTKKKCFVCGSLSHLIKDCDYFEKMLDIRKRLGHPVYFTVYYSS
ncbi:hypothetical protein Tco_1497791 [Tanacetum coccineum]